MTTWPLTVKRIVSVLVVGLIDVYLTSGSLVGIA
jgi:hypothetical protein